MPSSVHCPTLSYMRVLGLQSDRYFTHFELLRVMKLAARSLERAHAEKNGNLRQYLNSIFDLY